MTTASRPHMGPRDLMAEAITSMLIRPGRSFLTVLGTLVGVAAIVATIGVSSTAGNAIVSTFDLVGSTSISVVERQQEWGWGWGGEDRLQGLLPWDAGDRLERLNGVAAAGTISRVPLDGAPTRSTPIHDPLGRTEHLIDVLAVSPDAFEAVGAGLDTGRFFDVGHSDRSDPVAVLGPAAARRLNVHRVDHQPAIFVGEQPLVVIGILDDRAREAQFLDAVIIPNGTAVQRFGLEAVERVVIRTEVGATELVASQAAMALHPNEPSRLYVMAPTRPEAMREAIAEDVRTLFLALGAISLLVGAMSIANVTLVAVLERVDEIGLRRALGASRRHIAGQFLLESSLLGFLGGLLGASIGILAVVAVSLARTWTPVLEGWVPLVAPLAGATVGLVAGTYPSLHAARMEPVAALRSGT